MTHRFRQLLAVMLSLVLFTTSMPTAAIAEATEGIGLENADVTVTAPTVLYRTQHAATDPSQDVALLEDTDPAEDGGWSSFLSQHDEDSQELKGALTSLEMKVDDEALADALTYRAKGPDGTWQEAWTTSPFAAEDADGIAGIQAQLNDELDAAYDLWYRAQADDGTWFEWVQAPNALEAPELQYLHDFQAVLTLQGEQPVAVDTSDNPAANEPVAEQTQGEPTDLDPSQTTDQGGSKELSVEDAASSQNVGEGSDQLEVVDEEDLFVDAPANDGIEVQSSNKTESLAVVDSTNEATEQQGPAITVQSSPEDLTALASTTVTVPSIRYRANVYGNGWQKWVKNGSLAGTTGQSRMIRALRFKLGNANGGVQYRAHVQGIGWQKWTKDGALAGTVGTTKRLEAFKLKLTGSIADTYNVWYRAHVQGIGWQKWVKNGAVAGTTGRGLRVEAIEVVLARKTGSIPVNNVSGAKYKDTSTATTRAVRYQGYVTNSGWVQEVRNGAILGPVNDATPLEAIRISATGIDGSIQYRAHMHHSGWTGWKTNGAIAGQYGKDSYLEAVRVRLTGNAESQFDVYYRVFAQNLGWMNWTKNGNPAGTMGHSYRMSALQVKLVKRGSDGPADPSDVPFAFLGTVTSSYSANVRDSGWQDFVSQGATAGVTNAGARVTGIKATISRPIVGGIKYAVRNQDGTWQSWKSNGAVSGVTSGNVSALRFKLTGEASKHFDVWYRAHVAHYGWLGWAKNGKVVGTDSSAYPIEAYEVVITAKGAAAPGQVTRPYLVSDTLNGVDISGWDKGINVSGTFADFFVIKATEGVLGTIYNPWYSQWATEALNSGRLIGFYHYANGGDPLKEADSFYSAIQSYKGRAIACLDWEGQGNPLFGSGQDVAWCKKFLDRLKLRFGGTPLIYMSKDVTNRYDWSSVANVYPLWGAQYPNYEPVNGYQSNPWQSSAPWGAWGRDPLIFQYTSTGVLAHNGGIDSFDFDLFYGSASDWRKLQS